MSIPKISIHYDPYDLEDAKDTSTTVIYNTSNYPRAYKTVIESLKSEAITKLIVKDATVYAWLNKLKDKYTETSFDVREIKPGSFLSEKWGFTIPPDVTDREIVEMNLLNFAVDKEPYSNFTDFILTKFISNLMCSEKTPLDNMFSLVAAICADETQANLQRSLVRKEYERRLEEWLRNTNDAAEKEIIDCLIQDPKDLKRSLSIYAVVANYPPEVGKRAGGELIAALKKLHFNSSSIRIDTVAGQTAINNIEVFLNTQFKLGLSQSDPQKIVEWSSGLVPEEFRIILKIFEQSPYVLTDEILKSLERKFTIIIPEIQPELRKLSLLIKPKMPNSPEKSWDPAKMIEWAIQQYLPYHFWTEETRKEDDTLSNQSESYGDWLRDNFVNIRSNFQNIVFKILPAIIGMQTSEKCLLILVVDNFNYKFADTLTNMLQNRGFRLLQKTPYFSMIPSDTETSKRCLVAGQPKASEIPENYDSLIEMEWQQCFPQRHFSYLKSTLELETTKASIGDVLFVNCLQIDDVLHQEEKKLGKRHSVAIEAELHNITSLVAGFFNQNGLTNNAMIVICSDHGSTLIPANVQNELEPAYFVGKPIDAHHRFLKLSKIEYEKLPANIKFHCYYLDSESFGLPENVLIAKRYYRFRKTTEQSYVHGGLSPEETIVPLIVLEGGKISFQKPTLRLLQNEFRFLTRAGVEIEIVNENSLPIEEVKTTITPLERKDLVIIEPASIIEKINPSTLSKIKIACRLYKNFDPNQGLEITVEYRFMGKSYSETKVFPVQIKQMMGTSKLGDLQ